ncbi:hypothetical protein PUN28_005016 [Cardiocondyla obscurior]|uniref:Uncharacterized protein n=1 Tax=Cardiocondyla obscurior TaxID=286306 RepID=A0AAW2GFI3_9HYME
MTPREVRTDVVRHFVSRMKTYACDEGNVRKFCWRDHSEGNFVFYCARSCRSYPGFIYCNSTRDVIVVSGTSDRQGCAARPSLACLDNFLLFFFKQCAERRLNNYFALATISDVTIRASCRRRIFYLTFALFKKKNK